MFVYFQAYPLRLLTFDIYNTVIRVRGSPAFQYAAVASQHGLNVDVQHLGVVYKKTWKHMKKQYPNYGLNQGFVSKEWWLEFVQRVFCAAGFTNDTQKLGEIAEHLYIHYHKATTWHEMPEARSVLSALRQKGLHLAVISNFDETLETILKNMDLLQYFDFLVTSVEAKHEKPAPEIFRYALRKAGVNASEAAHVGDDVNTDYFGARKVGMHSFLLDCSQIVGTDHPDFHNVDQGCIIQSLPELQALVKSMTPQNPIGDTL